MRLLAESLDLGLDILSEIIWGPALRPDELEAERQVILEEILMHADEPAEEVHELFNSAMYPAHPLGRDVLGLEGTVKAATRDEIAAFHRQHYRTANIVVTAAGRVEHDRVVDGIVSRLDKAATEIGRDVLVGGGPPPRNLPSSPPKDRLVVKRQTEQAHVMVGMPGFDRNHPDRQVLNVLDHVLGGGMSSRLFQSIREERGLAYSVYSYRSGYQGAGDFAVYAGTGREREKSSSSSARSLTECRATGRPSRNCRQPRPISGGPRRSAWRTPGAATSRLGRSQLAHGRVPSLAELDSQVSAVTEKISHG